ncbi:Homeodomain-like domain-containing protein [Humidesulfovibrio mexicanus]|uniref:Homeodomain-like domain-containing protein n=1 Tax=Humidesulfovibrio mexicanus TaxID=147047 RepID=A0A238XZ77_9BACT|nr:helix-turn-helix domain-containing protein [Humidesulfovibrio mexicanus]SNR64012.1 Homeodomain-like domain-containing protein [Humidesulfovibrio mexicanus]
MTSKKLDIERFSKVYNLMNSTCYDGEREAARDRAEAIACAAGMTFEEAVDAISQLEAPTPMATESFRNPFAGFAEYMEQREPGYMARAAEEARQREEARLKECAKLIEQYGSEEAVMAACEREVLLEKACAHLAEVEEDGYISNLDGWGPLSKDEDLPVSVRQAVADAYILPKTVVEAWEEWRYWNRRMLERSTLDRYMDFHPLPVNARVVVLEELLFSLPAATVGDVIARIDRFEELCNQGWDVKQEDQDKFIKQLRNDVDFLSNSVQVGRQTPFTNAKKRDAVLEYLKCPERSLLSDREIARIVGVSPQTVNNWRKRLNVHFGHNR